LEADGRTPSECSERWEARSPGKGDVGGTGGQDVEGATAGKVGDAKPRNCYKVDWLYGSKTAPETWAKSVGWLQ